MVNKVQHLLQIEEIEEPKKPVKKRTRKTSVESDETLVDPSESEINS
tara:strand:+ start:1083 stop:1223 length:141 start_codon:yes stop_codon:yes gene_type:complete